MTFNVLCQLLKGKLDHHNPIGRTLSVEERIAITLWRLGTNVEYRTISHLFGVGLSTVCVTVHETCRVIVSKLMSVYIKVPRGEALRTIRDIGFLKSGIFHSVLEQ